MSGRSGLATATLRGLRSRAGDFLHGMSTTERPISGLLGTAKEDEMETRMQRLAERMESLRGELLRAPRWREGTPWWWKRIEAIEIWRAVLRREGQAARKN